MAWSLLPTRCPMCQRSRTTVVISRPAARSLQQRSRRLRLQAGNGDSDAPTKPQVQDCEDARSAIAVGRELCDKGQFEDAVEFFEKALDLPGTGTKRFRDKPPLPSFGEKQAAMYNLACCYSQLGDVHTGLVAFAGCLENGYSDVDQARADPDLEALRADARFEGLIKRLVPLAGAGVVGRFLNNLQLGKK